MIEDRWPNEGEGAGPEEPDLLVHRSRLLGSDPRITNSGGGNTSAKLPASDPLTGEPVVVLWVKGSGGDLGSIDRLGFATLYLDRVMALEGRYRGREHEDEMPGLLPYCDFGLNRRVASIDTPLHALLPFRHVDHMHPDAVIAIAASRRSEPLTAQAFEGRVGWLPWQRPGFDLAVRLRDAVRANPQWVGVVLAGHGLVTWGETSRACYHNTLGVARRAAEWIAGRARGPAFGGERVPARGPEERRALASTLMPVLRGKLAGRGPKVGHFDDSPAILELVGSSRVEALAALGTSCPDHFLRTKIRPLVLSPDPEHASAELESRLATYRREYEDYYRRCRRPESPEMRDPSPVVYLVPGIGLFSFAGDKVAARLAAELYLNAVNVMRGATAIDEYVALPEQEAFDIEYWALEEAKLRLLPAPPPLAGKVALVTGAGGAIGGASAGRLLEDGACVVLCDRDAETLEEARAALAGRFGGDRVTAQVADVTSEEDVTAAFALAARTFGGLDIHVASAGIASAAPVEATSLYEWRRNMEVLATGYFLSGREAMRLFRLQGTGGAIVFVGSKNALVASAGAAAYSSAKAAALHLARCLALEGARSGIRVNVVNPDAVIRGSRIWSGPWRTDRARAYGIAETDLEAHYRDRSLLGREVVPDDVAEAVAFLASDRAAKSTGNVLNVDAGNLAAFTR